MDVGAFVQENKRWLLGCAIGGVAWIIGGFVIGKVYVLKPVTAQGAPQNVLDAAARDQAKADQQLLAAERQRLQQAWAFMPSRKYQLGGNGTPGDYQYKVSRELRQTIVAAAAQRDVQVVESNLSWETPIGIDDIRGTLFALELVDEVQQRLFAAHDAARRANEEAVGLAAIPSIKVDARRNQRNQVRTVRPGEVDMRDVYAQEQITVQFQADEVTAFAFAEACRKPNRTMVIESWLLQKPSKPGEPCTVKCTLLGIAFKDESTKAEGANGKDEGAKGKGEGAKGGN